MADKKKGDKKPKYALSLKRRVKVDDPWRYTYMVVGDKKIGKTSFAIEDAEEFVFQLDRPQLAYDIREEYIRSYKQLMRVLTALEERAEADGDDFQINRIVVDDVGKVWTLIYADCLKHFQIEHPSEEGFARAWHWIRDKFNEFIDRLLAFKVDHGCGIVFISHSEWKEIKRRGTKETAEKLKADLPARCEKILEGKVDMWAVYDWDGEERVMVVIGDETTNAGHSIDGHFRTSDGRRVREIPMGDSAAEAMENFMTAFRNEQEFATMKERRKLELEERAAKRAKERAKAKKK